MADPTGFDILVTLVHTYRNADRQRFYLVRVMDGTPHYLVQRRNRQGVHEWFPVKQSILIALLRREAQKQGFEI